MKTLKDLTIELNKFMYSTGHSLEEIDGADLGANLLAWIKRNSDGQIESLYIEFSEQSQFMNNFTLADLAQDLADSKTASSLAEREGLK